MSLQHGKRLVFQFISWQGCISASPGQPCSLISRSCSTIRQRLPTTSRRCIVADAQRIASIDICRRRISSSLPAGVLR
ncbi:hypothetical protein BDW72DRAFT_182820 [Aspergillus terricola var. indicus]